MDMSDWFRSVAGVAAFAIAAAQLLKKSAPEVRYLNQVPLVIYVLVFCVFGTWFSHAVLGTLVVEDGGNFALLVTQVITTAFIAIGAWEFTTNLAKPMKDSGSPGFEHRNFFGAKKFVALFAIMALGASACSARGANPALSVEGNIAVRATQLVAALNNLTVPAGTSPIEQAVAGQVLTVREAVAVAEAVRESGRYAQDLAVVLTAVHGARTEAARAEGLGRASVLVQSIQKSLMNATLRIGTESGRKTVIDLLSVSANLLLTIGTVFHPVGLGAPPSDFEQLFAL